MFVEMKTGDRAYSISAAIDKISLRVLVNSYTNPYSILVWMNE